MLVEFLSGVNDCRLEVFWAVEETNDIRQGFHSINLDIVYDSGFSDILFGYNESNELLFPGLDGNGQRTADGLQASVKSQFTHQHVMGQKVGDNLSVGSKNANGQREVVAGTFFADICGW